MRAIQFETFGGPDVMKAVQAPDPKAGPGEVVVTAKAIGVNPVDTYIRSGIYGDRPFPFTPGLDASGVVKAVGPDVRAVKVNDRVYVAGSLSGAYAEQILCKASQVHPLPEKVSFEQGAAIGVPYATAYYALFHRGHAMPGERVLIHGASGGVGSAAVQLARSRGLVVFGTGGTEKGRKLVSDEGAQYVLDHHAPDYLEQLMTFTGGRGVDLIIEMLANVNLGKDLKVLAPRGRVVVVGSRGKVEIEPRESMSRNTDIRGMSLLNVSEQELTGVHAALIAGFESGILKPVIGQKYSLAEASRAHQAVLEAGANGKIILVP